MGFGTAGFGTAGLSTAGLNTARRRRGLPRCSVGSVGGVGVGACRLPEGHRRTDSQCERQRSDAPDVDHSSSTFGSHCSQLKEQQANESAFRHHPGADD
jgi:hypothetical protein